MIRRPIREVRRLADARWKLVLPRDERTVLASLAPQLRELLSTPEGSPELRRLFPAAYADDDQAEAFYQQLTHDDLATARLANLDRFEHAVQADELALEDLQGLMGSLNDLRLVLGTSLDVSEDVESFEFDEADPRAWSMQLYLYLGMLLELVVEAMFDTVIQPNEE